MEPLGQSQILPYLIGLANRGYSLTVLSFEKAALLEDEDRVGAQCKVLKEVGIQWSPRIYHRGSSVQDLALDILETSREVSRRSKKGQADLIHCRAHVPFMMAWHASVFHGKPILFDFRGFLAEEYVDAGLWKPNSLKFKLTK